MVLDLLLQAVFRSSNVGLANRGVSFGLGQKWGNMFSIVGLVIFLFIFLSTRGRKAVAIHAPRHCEERSDEAIPAKRYCMRLLRFEYKTRNDDVRNDGLLLIALGGIGNILSRLVWGGVWDYICFPFLPFCFNLSDVLISLGVVSYILGVNGNRSTLRGQRDTGN